MAIDTGGQAPCEDGVAERGETAPAPYKDSKGWFLPGNSYGTGNKGRERLSRAFLRDMLADWEVHGRETIARVRGEKPERYLQLVAQLVPRTVQLEVGEFEEMSDEDLRRALAESLNELAESGGELIASLPRKTRDVLDLEPVARRLS